MGKPIAHIDLGSVLLPLTENPDGSVRINHYETLTSMFDENISAWFKDGYSMEYLASKYICSLEIIEESIRRTLREQERL